MADRPLRLLIIGAHPDDADYFAGGTAALYRQAVHVVKMVSMTNGDAGHQTLRASALANRRRAEAAAAGAVIGATYDVMDNHDGQLIPSLENRFQVIRLIRSFQPDLVLTHRPNDYHPDHRYTSQLVQDAAYMVTVPAIVPDTPHLKTNPVIAYLPDEFQKPYPFQPAVAVDVTSVFDKIIDMLHCHQSQFYEWLPFNGLYEDKVPTEESARRLWLADQIRPRLKGQSERFREVLARRMGAERALRMEVAEGFEACEYGAPLDDVAVERLFGFLK